MPGSPPNSPIFALPRFSNDDVTDFAGQVNSVVDRLETALNALVPVGLPFAWPGPALPVFPLPTGVSAVAGTTPEFAWADGGLIDRTVYVAFFTVTGHAYNAGVDPGANKVRKPDKRGRVTVGADTMGGLAAGRLPNSNRALGQNDGEERHTLTVAELAAHAHGYPISLLQDEAQAASSGGALGFAPGAAGVTRSNGTANAGGGGAHNNMQPFEVDNVIVRIA